MNFRLWIAALILLIACPAFPAGDAATDTEMFEGIYIKADDSEYDFDTQRFHAGGNTFVRYNDFSVTADQVTGDASSGDFEATGNVTFTQGDNVVKGRKFIYNYKTKIGHSTDASASVENIHFHGDEMDSNPDGYSLTGSRFTTCDLEKPHYYLSARELIVRPGDKMIARDVRIVALGKTLLRVPRYTVGLRAGGGPGIKLPSMGVSSRYGTYIAHSLNVSSKPGLSGELALRLSTEQSFQGGIKLSRIADRPFTFNLTHREQYYGGRNPDTILSRLPEVAYRFQSNDMSALARDRDDTLYLSRAVLDPRQESESRGRVHMIGELGAGQFKEEPSDVESTRLDFRAMAWLDPIHLGDTILMPAILTRVSHYGTGDDYTALGLQFAAARKLGSNSYVSLTYVTHAIGGTTPFDFDPIEVPHELAGRLRFPLGNFGIELAARYDVQNSLMFDSEISVSRPMHCVEPKLTWRNRFREFSFSVGLVGF